MIYVGCVFVMFVVLGIVLDIYNIYLINLSEFNYMSI